MSLPPVQDHEPIYDGDSGPSTGGMGCYALARVGTPRLIEEVHRTILEPTTWHEKRTSVALIYVRGGY